MLTLKEELEKMTYSHSSHLCQEMIDDLKRVIKRHFVDSSENRNQVKMRKEL